MAISTQKITFTGAQGHQLAARLDLPVGTPKAYALFAHCFTCSKDIFAASRIASELAARGFAVLRFDFTGLGASEGEFSNTNFSSNVGDLIAAAKHMRETWEAPAIMIGHSLGGAAVLVAAASCPDVKAVATIGAPADAAHVIQNFGAKLDEIEENGAAEVSLAGRKFTIKQQFLDDLNAQSMNETIGKLRKALLVFHAPTDNIVGIENAGEIFGAAKHPKSFVSLDDADHLLSRRVDAEFVADVLSAWARRYVPFNQSLGNQSLGNQTKDGIHPAPAKAAAGVVRVVETGQGKFQQHVLVDDHRLIADEPVSYGGLASGPSPYDFLGIALGACTTMTLRMYGARKGLKLRRVQVDVTHAKIHAKDCTDCGEGREGRVDRFERLLTIEGDLTPEQKERLVEIADLCPVHKTLQKSSTIATKLAGES